MSLYGGIKLSGSKPPAQAASSPAPTPSRSKSPVAVGLSLDQDKDKPRPSTTTWSAALRFAPVQRKKPAAFSSSSSAGPHAPRPLATAFSSALDDDDDDEPSAAPPGAAGAPRIARVGKASLNVEPVKRPPPSKWGAGSSMAAQEAILLEAKAKAAAAAAAQAASTSSAQSSTSAPALRRTGAPTRIRRAIPIPPSMTLEDDTILPQPSAVGTDVNGFASTAMGIKLAKEQEKKNHKRGKKRKGQGGGGAAEDPALRYGDIPYDPARPCDYAGYKTHVKLARAQRRLDREEEERQRRRREGSAGSGSSYYSEDDQDGRDEHLNEPSKRARFFAPPTSYDEQGPSFPPPANPEATSFTPAPSLAAPSREETADEAYARRVALSNPAPPSREETGDEAYQRRIAMSQRPPASLESRDDPSTRRGIGGSTPASSTQSPAPPSFITSSFVPPTTFAPPSMGSSSFPPGVPPPPPPGFVPPPAFFETHAEPRHPVSMPPPPPPLPPSASVPPSSDEPKPSAAVDAAAARAREIAARLSKLGGAFSAGPPPPPVPPPESFPSSSSSSSSSYFPTFQAAQSHTAGAAPTELDDRPFAERMMSKYGWTSGKGLGADESGIKTALSVSRPSAGAGGQAKPALSRAQKKKQKHFGIPTTASAANDAPTTGMASRNNVIDSSRSVRTELRDREMGGEPGRVVLLENVCAPQDVDDDLPGEIADEANKLGVVERCAVVVVPVAIDDEDEEVEDKVVEREEVRVFLVMSGLAGAYNAVRSFEGRFFGGRTVRARYYDETAFKAGEHYL